MIQRRLAALGLLVGLAVAGCSSPQTNFYTLASVDAPSTAPATARPGLTIGVGPVRLPEYVDRPEIVIRRNAYAVDLAIFDNWAAPLDDRFPEVLILDLAAQLPADQVIVFPPRLPTPVDVQVEVSVNQFDVDTAGTATLIAEWRLRSPGGQPLPQTGRTRVTATATDASMQAKVAALSQTVVQLSAELARTLAAFTPATSNAAARPLSAAR